MLNSTAASSIIILIFAVSNREEKNRTYAGQGKELCCQNTDKGYSILETEWKSKEI